MKIVHVVRTLDPAEGGPPQVAVRLAAAQAALDHDVHLVCYARTTDGTRVEQQLANVPHRDRVHFHFVRDPARVEGWLGRRARRTIGDVCRDADFVHIHGLWGAILRGAAEVARARGIPYCFRPAGMLDPWSLAQKRWKKRLALAIGYRAALASSAFIHVLNADEARLIEPLRLCVEPVVLPNGVFLEEMAPLPPPGTFRGARPELGDAPFILFLARLHFKKGLDVLAETFALVAARRADVHLVVAGPDDGARADFERLVAASGAGDRVHLVGALYGRDKFAALVDAACFCLPSRQEGFSVAVTEAMAVGRPVVISEACHFPEVAAVGAGTIVRLDAMALAAALGEVLDEPRRAAHMGAAGAALVRERYTWNAIAVRSIAMYESARRARRA